MQSQASQGSKMACNNLGISLAILSLSLSLLLFWPYCLGQHSQPNQHCVCFHQFEGSLSQFKVASQTLILRPLHKAQVPLHLYSVDSKALADSLPSISSDLCPEWNAISPSVTHAPHALPYAGDHGC